MAKRKGHSSKKAHSTKRNRSSNNSSALWTIIKLFLAIVFWPFTIIYLICRFIISLISRKKDEESKPVAQEPAGIVSPYSNSSAATSADEDIYQQAGVYTPTYSFSTVDGYKDRLKNIRERQKDMIRDKTACFYPLNFTFNDSQAEGNRVVNDWMRLMLRAFNGESDVIIDHVSYLNYESSQERIKRSAESINAIGKRMQISISSRYVSLKLDELAIAYDFQQFKQAEKERLRQIREEEREKAKLEKELQERRAKIIKDQKHVATELSSLIARLSTATPEEAATLETRITELNDYTQKLQEDLANVEHRERQARAGYVYIISNIGSFGENVYKIGMTRRLDPQDRVDELGDASVPFRFDVHAFIFSEDAVALESALHNAFNSRRVNLVNLRREFFNVTLDEIEACVKANFSETVEFTRTATAQEYRESIALRKATPAA